MKKPWYVSKKKHAAWRARVKDAIAEQKLHEEIHRAVPEHRSTSTVASHADVRAVAVAQRMYRAVVMREGRRVRITDGEAKWPKWIQALLDEEVAREWGEG